MKTGLTLGKYSPFHTGHQSLIELALNEMDHLIVVIYNSPETTHIPLKIRANWIRQIYPQVEVIEAWDGPTEIGNTETIKKKQEHYLLKLLKNRKITSFYCSEFYGEHISQLFHAENRQVPKSILISGSIIRKNIYQYKNFLDPIVYQDHILNIAFVGAPSTGKSTICKKLAQALNTVWMPEFGREYWETHHKNRRLSKEQLVEIATIHLDQENKLIQQANRYIFCDTNAITTYMFGKYYHGKVLPELQHLAEQAEKRYDLFFLCDDDIPYDDTPDRSGELNRKWFQYEIESDLKVRKLPYIKLSGTIEERMNRVKKMIRDLKKYDCPFINYLKK
ncbi:MAG: AAA family ATPase [Spirochaetes bacterium]|nr:AAA family ATPase [Spirochaetota bacterium]